MKEIELKNGKRVEILAIVLFASVALAATLLLLPPVQNIAIAFGEKILGRELRDYSKWHRMMIGYGGLFLLTDIAFAVIYLDRKTKFANNIDNIITERFIIIFMLVIVIVSFVLEPVTGDVKVFLGGANQANFLKGNLLVKALNQWELKGFLNRFLFVILYTIAKIFVPFSTFEFEIASSLVYVSIASFVLALSVKFANPMKNMADNLFNIFLLLIAFLGVQIWHRMQAEMSSAILIFFAFCLYMNAVKTNNKIALKLLCAGFILGSLCFFKTVLIFMAISFVAACYIYDKEKDLSPSWKKFFLLFGGGLISLTVGFSLIMIINPNEIKDILDASVFQSTIFSSKFSLSTIKKATVPFFANLRDCLPGIPVLLLGILNFLKNIISNIKKREYDQIFFRLIMWIIPSAIIIMGSHYFWYHYYSFVPVSIFEIYLTKSTYKHFSNAKKILYTLCAFVPISFFLQISQYSLYETTSKTMIFLTIFVSIVSTVNYSCINIKKEKSCYEFDRLVPIILVLFVYVNYISIFSHNARTYIQLDKKTFVQNKIVSAINLADKNKSFLYLDGGHSSYYIGNRSWDKYFFALPLQRISEKSPYVNLECYQNEFSNTMNYEGEFIFLAEEWFFGSTNTWKEQIKNKIENEYIYFGSYKGFSVPVDLFNGLHSGGTGDCDVYKRKSNMND